ncbi:MAG TPA: hypothetical protein VEK07_19525 [Polyangiaceae bacterium]|nr:hypothetical protein [Polyangiaceae bacterium]
MPDPRRWSAAAWSALGACSLPACVDLFHSTSDVRTACEIDAAACASDSDTVTAATVSADLCAAPDLARQNAAHACAWLGACVSPMGNNAFGPCMFQALMTFDCAANPNHVVLGAAREQWACLAQAGSCKEVQECVFPDGFPGCAAPDTTVCGGVSRDGGVGSAAARVECGDSGPTTVGAEDCTLWGETCIADAASASCGENAAGLVCDGGAVDSCLGTQVSWCGLTGTESGIDCAGNGAGSCRKVTASQAAWVSCVPIADADAGACSPTLEVICQNGVAQSCPTGVPETLDCGALLGDSAAACNEVLLDPPFDWTSPCDLTPSQCDADTCDGSVLTSCARGAAFSVDCASENLGACEIVSTDLQTEQHSACLAPPTP